jgi:cell division protein FtsW
MKVATTLLVLCVGSLLMLGMVMLYSSSMVQVGARYLLMQLAWGGLGLLACVAAACLDYRWLNTRIAWAIYGLSVLLLVLVFVPGVGVRVNGAWRWLEVGGLRFQPSEVAKVALIIALARYLALSERQIADFGRGVVVPGLMIGTVVSLIFIEPDRGTSVLATAVCGTLLLVAGVPWKFVVPPVLGFIGFLAFSVWNDPMRLARILSWLDPEKTKHGVGYQAWNAMLAFGTGGWWGQGLGNGRQKHGFLPEHHTDFIFSIIGEELGLIATLGVVLGFVVFVLCGLFIAWNARDNFGLYLGCGITFLIGFQALINIGVVTSYLPNKGLPLPFISYGGSNLLMLLTGVGMLLSIARHAGERRVAERNPFRPRDVLSPQHT